MRLRPLDFVVLLISAAAVALSSAWAYARGGRLEAVATGESGEWVYPLSEDRRFEVPGPLGATTVLIEDGAARILDSPCPNKTCMASRPIRTAGQWMACLPNRVFVRVEGADDEGGVDAAAY